jgi:hypothetical protein
MIVLDVVIDRGSVVPYLASSEAALASSYSSSSSLLLKAPVHD